MSAQQHTIKARIVRFHAKPSLLITVIPWKKARADKHVIIVYKLWTSQLLYSPAPQEMLIRNSEALWESEKVKPSWMQCQTFLYDSRDHRNVFTSS